MGLDPQIKRFLDRLAAMNPPSALALSVSQRRSAIESLLSLGGEKEPVAHVEERLLPIPRGRVGIRIYTPMDPEPLPAAFVFFHGGGLVAGSLDTHDGICRSLACAGRCRLISVDYPLAPEHPFPAALSASYAATQWIAEHPQLLQIDPHRLIIGGDSAGATLAAVICQMATTRKEVRFALQVLLCPIVDFSASTPSRCEFAQGYLVDEATLAHDLKHYLGPDALATDPRVSPGRAADVADLPPTCIHTAEFDPLRDEGKAFAERLQQAGVKTTYRCHSGMIHLFYGMGALIPSVARAYELIGADMRSLLRPPTLQGSVR